MSDLRRITVRWSARVVIAVIGLGLLLIVGLAVLIFWVRPYGYIDQTGRCVINLNRWNDSEAYGFSDGMAVVGGYTFISATGKYLQVDSPSVGYFHDGLAPVQKGLLYGYIDKGGAYKIAPRFAKVGNFSEGMAAVKLGEKWGYIDVNGRMVIEPQFDFGQEFSCGLAGVDKGPLSGFIDRSGKWVVPAKYNGVVPYAEGFGFGIMGDVINNYVLNKSTAGDSDRRRAQRSSRVCSYLDHEGREIYKFTVDGDNKANDDNAVSKESASNFIERWIEPHSKTTGFSNKSFSGGLAVAEEGGKYGYIDKSFKFVIPPSFDFAYRFSEGMAVVYNEERDRFAYIDATGKLVTPFRFLDASSFYDGLACVREFSLENPLSLYGYIDKSGHYKILPLFERASPFSEQKALVGESIQML